jgi:protein required for attachment to host cells
MNKLLLIIVMVSANVLFAQMNNPIHPRHMMERHGKELRMLEQVKLLDYLNLDEENAVRFISRLKTFLNNKKKLNDERKTLLDSISTLLEKKQSGFDYKNLVNKEIAIEQKLLQQRKDFIKNLKNILTQEQIAKVIVFENRFKKDVMKMMFRRGKMMRNPKENPTRQE